MNRVMFRRAAIDLRRTAMWFALGLVIYAGLISAFFPSIRDTSAAIQQFIETYPDALLKAFGLGSGVDFGQYAVFISAEYLSFIWPLIVSIFVIMAGAATVGREVDSGTAELWLSVPETRWKLLLSKMLAIASAVVVLVVITVVTVWIASVLLDATLAIGDLARAALTMTVFAWATTGIACFCSSFSQDRGRAAGIAAAIVLASYLLDVLSGIDESWNWLHYLSYYSAYGPQDALRSGVLHPLNLLALLAVAVVTALAALLIFDRRDIEL